MKTILAGTDFSPASVNACRYAALVAQKLNCKLTIFNLYQTPVYHSNMGLIGISSPTLKRQSKQGVENIISQLSDDFPGLKVSALASPNALKDELESFINKHQVAAVVMGLEAKDKLSKFIYGSKGVSIGGKLKAPVIIVPGKYVDHRLETLLLAVDNLEKFRSSSIKSIEQFAKVGQICLKPLHIKTPDEIICLQTGSLKLNGERKEIEVCKSKTIESGIKRYSSDNEVDLVSIISKKHSAFYNLFNESVTKRVAFSAKVPVMAIHE